jgi:hypothetical protein
MCCPFFVTCKLAEENRRHARLVRKAHRLAVADLLEIAAMKGVAQAAGPGQASSSQEALPHLLEEALPQVGRPLQAPPAAPDVGSVRLGTKAHLSNALPGQLMVLHLLPSVAPHNTDVCPWSYVRCRKPIHLLHVPQLYANVAH